MPTRTDLSIPKVPARQLRRNRRASKYRRSVGGPELDAISAQCQQAAIFSRDFELDPACMDLLNLSDVIFGESLHTPDMNSRFAQRVQRGSGRMVGNAEVITGTIYPHSNSVAAVKQSTSAAVPREPCCSSRGIDGTRTSLEWTPKLRQVLYLPHDYFRVAASFLPTTRPILPPAGNADSLRHSGSPTRFRSSTKRGSDRRLSIRASVAR